MMHAGEEYRKSVLQARTPVPIARPGASRGPLAV
jgi:hypothetical protein